MPDGVVAAKSICPSGDGMTGQIERQAGGPGGAVVRLSADTHICCKRIGYPKGVSRIALKARRRARDHASRESPRYRLC